MWCWRERHPYLPGATIPCHGTVGGGRGSTLRGDGPVIEDRLRARTSGALTRVAGLIARTGATPNTLTLLGFLGMAAAGVLCAAGSFFAAGLVVAASCAFDALDGALARATGAASVSMERSSTRSWTATPRLRSTGDWLCITQGRPGASRPRLPRQSDR